MRFEFAASQWLRSIGCSSLTRAREQGRRGGRALSEGEREREGGGEGDVGDGDGAQSGRAVRARAAHFDERGRPRSCSGKRKARGRVWSEGEREGAGEGDEGDGGRRASRARAAHMDSASERGTRTASASTSQNASSPRS